MNHILMIMETEKSKETELVKYDWANLVKEVLVKSQNTNAADSFLESLKTFFKKASVYPWSIEIIFTPLFEISLNEAIKTPKVSYRLFSALSEVMSDDPEHIGSLIKLHLRFEDLWEPLNNAISSCIDEQGEEKIKGILLKFLASLCLSTKEEFNEWLNKSEESFRTFLQKFIFVHESKEQECQLGTEETTRIEAIHFMNSTMRMSAKARSIIFENTAELLEKISWRTANFKDWNLRLTVSEKRKTKYSGLVNLGCICYMNSVFQQLFMIDKFRNHIIANEIAVDNPDEITSSPLFQFQVLMKALRDVQRSFHSPAHFCKTFKNFDGSEINVLQQMDADEFLTHLMDKLEIELKEAKSGDVISRTFGGCPSHDIICKDCPHKSERTTPMITLPLEVKGNLNLKQCLDKYIAGEILGGENKYYCEKCDKKVEAVMRESIKKLPNVLIIVLKRFSFNYDSMVKLKINDFCEFPDTLDLSKYTQESLNGDDLAHPMDYYNFNLRGVVVHKGTSDSGHYYSLIKDGEDKWYEFNDKLVREFNYMDMAKEAYGVPVGGVKDAPKKESKSGFGGNEESKGTNAYMLFYERSSLYDENGNPIPDLLHGLTRDNPKELTSKVSQELQNENFELYLKQLLLQDQFISTLFTEGNGISQNEIDEIKSNETMLKVAFKSFFEVLLRKNSKSLLPKVFKQLLTLLDSSEEISLWFFRNISNQEFVAEYLLDCCIIDMRYFSVGLIKSSIRKLKESSSEETKEVFTECINRLVSIILKEMKLANWSPKMQKHNYEILSILAEFSHVSAFLSEVKFPELVFSLIIDGWKEDGAVLLNKLDEVELNQPGVFSGYLGSSNNSKLLSIEDINYRNKGREVIAKDFKNDFSYLFKALAIVLKNNPNAHPEVKEQLFKDGTWKKIIATAKSKSTCYPFIEIFSGYVIEYEKVEQVLESIVPILKKNDPSILHGFLYLLRRIALPHDSEEKAAYTSRVRN